MCPHLENGHLIAKKIMFNAKAFQRSKTLKYGVPMLVSNVILRFKGKSKRFMLTSLCCEFHVIHQIVVVNPIE